MGAGEGWGLLFSENGTPVVGSGHWSLTLGWSSLSPLVGRAGGFWPTAAYLSHPDSWAHPGRRTGLLRCTG